MEGVQYENKREEKQHADSWFPYNIYLCSIPLDFRIVPIHWHEEMELISVKRGNGLISLDLQTFSVQEGDLIVIFPGSLHSIRQKPGYSMEYENIIFRLDMLIPALPDCCSCEFLLPLLSENGASSYIWPRDEESFSLAQNQIKALDQLSNDHPYGYLLAIKGIFFQLLFLILGVERKRELPKSGQIYHQEKIKQIIKEVEERYKENLTIKEMAKLCGYSTSHFMKFFRQQMKMPFIEYVNDYRLIMAARQLLNGEEGISQIAQSTGFDQPSYFNRLFKRKYGMTPKQYRRQMQKKNTVVAGAEKE